MKQSLLRQRPCCPCQMPGVHMVLVAVTSTACKLPVPLLCPHSKYGCAASLCGGPTVFCCPCRTLARPCHWTTTGACTCSKRRWTEASTGLMWPSLILQQTCLVSSIRSKSRAKPAAAVASAAAVADRQHCDIHQSCGIGLAVVLPATVYQAFPSNDCICFQHKAGTHVVHQVLCTSGVWQAISISSLMASP